MSLLPLIFDELGDWDSSRPSRLHDQHFGLGVAPSDLLSPYLPRSIRRLAASPYYRPWSSRSQTKDEGSIVSFGKDKFQANLDVQQFKPEEITVKVTDDNTITIEGKHEEKEDEHGYVSRHFIRRYRLPKDHDISKAKSEFSTDGILTITAPKIEKQEVKHVEIPVIQTGKPAKALEDSPEKSSVENGEAMESDKPEPKRRKR